MIAPTIGRVVWYKSSTMSDQFMSASIVYVLSEELINISYSHPNGAMQAAQSVTLFQGDAGDCPDGQCCWMPYQQKQAAKH